MPPKGSKTIKVTLKKSTIGRLPKHRKSVYGLGLRKIGQQVELEDTPSVRGMINKVSYMVEVSE
ncbi:MAG: 50S ribosomal protein L30 [Gammaproteobacteria bacterium]|nr:50S ribosomal protein L30 [Gammaproteobacteria bacterium]